MSKREMKGKIEGTIAAWESRELGADENYVEVANGFDEKAADDALALKAISIRLQQSLVDDLKAIAKINGIGYQPLVRQVLNRFADCEKKRLLREKMAELEHQTNGPNDPKPRQRANG